VPKKKILVADDEADIRQLLQKALGRDYVVIEAEDGIEAVNMANAEKPDLILLDIMMPRQDGYKTCIKVKASEATKNIPVVMLTGVDYELNRKLGEQLGAAAYITKPFQIDILKDTIRRLL